MSQVVKAFYGLLALLALYFTNASSTNVNIFNWTTCEGRNAILCNCTSDVFTDVIARCDFNQVTDLRTIINFPQDVFRLNLSGNSIKEIPSNSFSDYNQLIYLSLSSNQIQAINQSAFNGLPNLRELNLEDNMIKQWDTTSIEQDIPNLIMLRIAQNMYWKPDKQILSLSNLKIVYLLSAAFLAGTHTSSWVRCHLVRSNLTLLDANTFIENVPRRFHEKVEPYTATIMSDFCHAFRLRFQDEYFRLNIDRAGYHLHSEVYVQQNRNLSKKSLEVPSQKKWYSFEWIATPKCWSLINSIFYVPLTEGLCAMVFNLIVIITTVRSRVLRESVAHVLVANIAVGDLLVSFYTIIITSTRQMMDAIEYADFYLPYYCRIVGFIFLIGQFSSPMMSFIMTLERYLAVVYCMRPHIRITRRMAFIATVIFWSLFLSLAVSFMTSPQFSLTTTDVCIPFYNTDGVLVMIYIGGIGIVLYITSMALYGHMYLDFQKTNHKTVQLQRENRFARRIALITFTNVLFFILPLIITVIVENFVNISNFDKRVFLATFVMSCFALNSCLNPILFSFRNETFRRECRRHYFGCTNTIASQT